MGIIPHEAAKPIQDAVEQVTYEEVKEKEQAIKHDIMAVVNVMAEKAGKWGEYLHWGLTSADIKDTAKVLLAKHSLTSITEKLKDTIILLGRLAHRWKNLPCVGRTHGMHANVYLFGRKFAVFAAELLRNLERIEESEKRIYVGKLAGSVGTHTTLGKKGEEMERRVLASFGLSPAGIATQVLSRDRFAELLWTMGLLATSLEKIAVEIRNLQRTEIGEVEEPFGSNQVGSSAMPHKRNPIRSENITGLARIVRSLVLAGLENDVLWHERDLSNSGPERALLPEAFLLVSEQLNKLKSVLGGLHVNEEKIKENLWLTNGRIFSERLTMELATKIGRQNAHELVRTVAMQAYKQAKSFKEVIQESKVAQHLTGEEIEAVFDTEAMVTVAKRQTTKILHTIETKLGVDVHGTGDD